MELYILNFSDDIIDIRPITYHDVVSEFYPSSKVVSRFMVSGFVQIRIFKYIVDADNNHFDETTHHHEVYVRKKLKNHMLINKLSEFIK